MSNKDARKTLEDKLEKNDDHMILFHAPCKQCKNCKYRQADLEINGKVIPKYNSALCGKHHIKPYDIMWDKKKCEYREDAGTGISDKKIISQKDYTAMMDKLQELGGNLTVEEKKRRSIWIGAKIPPRYFEKHSSKEINDQLGVTVMDDAIRETMILYQRIQELVDALVAQVSMITKVN